MKIPVIDISPLTPLQTNLKTSISETTFDAENMKQKLDLEIITLRNRSIPINNTPKINNKTSKMKESINKKENESPVKSNRRKSLKLLQTDENNYTQSDENIEANKNVYKRRSSPRKSVAFNVE